jgi:hypothetical protein
MHGRELKVHMLSEHHVLEEEAGKEDNRESSDDADRFEALFKSLSLSPPLHLDMWRRFGSPFSPSLSLPSPTLLLSTFRDFDTHATGARVLICSPEPEHVLQIVISIHQNQ